MFASMILLAAGGYVFFAAGTIVSRESIRAKESQLEFAEKNEISISKIRLEPDKNQLELKALLENQHNEATLRQNDLKKMLEKQSFETTQMQYKLEEKLEEQSNEAALRQNELEEKINSMHIAVEQLKAENLLLEQKLLKKQPLE